MQEQDFLKHYVQNVRHLMWFLGAGTSRSRVADRERHHLGFKAQILLRRYAGRTVPISDC